MRLKIVTLEGVQSPIAHDRNEAACSPTCPYTRAIDDRDWRCQLFGKRLAQNRSGEFVRVSECTRWCQHQTAWDEDYVIRAASEMDATSRVKALVRARGSGRVVFACDGMPTPFEISVQSTAAGVVLRGETYAGNVKVSADRTIRAVELDTAVDPSFGASLYVSDVIGQMQVCVRSLLSDYERQKETQP